jgi:hypothetical protein
MTLQWLTIYGIAIDYNTARMFQTLTITPLGNLGHLHRLTAANQLTNQSISQPSAMEF